VSTATTETTSGNVSSTIVMIAEVADTTNADGASDIICNDDGTEPADYTATAIEVNTEDGGDGGASADVGDTTDDTATAIEVNTEDGGATADVGDTTDDTAIAIEVNTEDGSDDGVSADVGDTTDDTAIAIEVNTEDGSDGSVCPDVADSTDSADIGIISDGTDFSNTDSSVSSVSDSHGDILVSGVGVGDADPLLNPASGNSDDNNVLSGSANLVISSNEEIDCLFSGANAGSNDSIAGVDYSAGCPDSATDRDNNTGICVNIFVDTGNSGLNDCHWSC
jgi:hypothetical protein